MMRNLKAFFLRNFSGVLHDLLHKFRKKWFFSRLQLKTPTQLFASEFWENFKNIFSIKHHWVAASKCLSSSKYAFLLV